MTTAGKSYSDASVLAKYLGDMVAQDRPQVGLRALIEALEAHIVRHVEPSSRAALIKFLPDVMTADIERMTKQERNAA